MITSVLATRRPPRATSPVVVLAPVAAMAGCGGPMAPLPVALRRAAPDGKARLPA